MDIWICNDICCLWRMFAHIPIPVDDNPEVNPLLSLLFVPCIASLFNNSIRESFLIFSKCHPNVKVVSKQPVKRDFCRIHMISWIASYQQRLTEIISRISIHVRYFLWDAITHPVYSLFNKASCNLVVGCCLPIQHTVNLTICNRFVWETYHRS